MTATGPILLLPMLESVARGDLVGRLMEMRKPLGCVALKLPDTLAIACWALDAPEFSSVNRRRAIDNAADAQAMRGMSERAPQILVRGIESFVISFDAFLTWQSDYELLDAASYTTSDASERERSDGVDVVLRFYPQPPTGSGRYLRDERSP